MCKNIFLIFFGKFPVFTLSGKMDLQIPCLPRFVATLKLPKCKLTTQQVLLHLCKPQVLLLLHLLSHVNGLVSEITEVASMNSEVYGSLYNETLSYFSQK